MGLVHPIESLSIPGLAADLTLGMWEECHLEKIDYSKWKDKLGNPEIYHLWFEYLKENDCYTTYCEWYNRNFPGAGRFYSFYPWNVDSTKNPVKRLLFGGEPIIKNYEPPPEILRNCSYAGNLTLTYSYWGDVRTMAWQKALDTVSDPYFGRGYHLLKPDEPYFKPAVMVFPRFISPAICPDQDSLFKLQQELLTWCTKNLNREGIFLNIPLYDGVSKKELIEEISSKIEKCADMATKKKQAPRPIKNLPANQIEKLWRYLRIWRLVKREGIGLEGAIKKLDPDYKIHKQFHADRSWRRDISNADEIIENAAKGDFPGVYGDYRKKKERSGRHKKN